MLNKRIIISALILASASSAFADDSKISYTNIGLSYQKLDISDDDFSGFGVSGSAAIGKSFFAIAEYNSIKSDDDFINNTTFVIDKLKVTQANVGFGFHTPISTKVDFVTALSYANVKVKHASISDNGNGYLIDAGIRAKPNNTFELAAFINHANIEDESDTGFSLSARVFASPKFSIGLGYSAADETDTVGIDIRLDI